jgi:hypothetical protein
MLHAPPLFTFTNNIWYRVYITKLPIMQFSPGSCNFVCFGFTYSPQHPVPKRPQYDMSLVSEYKICAHTKEKGTCFILLLLW